jgi:hypothetical protein
VATTETEAKVALNVLVPPSLRNEIAGAACDESRSISAMTGILLREALDHRAAGGQDG